MILDVPHIDSPRLATGIGLLRDDGGFRLEGVEFVLIDGCLQCRVQSSWDPENLSDDFALRDFDRAKHIYDELSLKSTEFAHTVDGLSAQFALIDDYGMGAIELARFKNGGVQWRTIPASVRHDIPRLLDYLCANDFKMRNATIGTMHTYSISFVGPQMLTITCDRGQLILDGDRRQLESKGLWRAFGCYEEFEESVIRYLARNGDNAAEQSGERERD